MLTKKNEVLYSLGDVTIIPGESTTILHRSQCDPFTKSIEGKENYYPVIAAPMASVISPENYKLFHEQGISCIIPRNIPLEERKKLCMEVICAFSLNEVEENFINNKYSLLGDKLHILIDIANGHMVKEIAIGKTLKELYGDNVILMGGNIANPQTYFLYNDAGFDFLRLGIGGGSQCITSTQLGVHYPMASLIGDTVELMRDKGIYFDKGRTKIIADGGINSFSDAIKCLALGADYVMMGKVFAKAKEACGDTFVMYDEKSGNPRTYRRYYGMSTKRAQAEILGYNTIEEAKKDTIKLKTAEGRSEDLLIEYTLQGWVENFDSYLRSAMSYTGSAYLSTFPMRGEVRVISSLSGTLINSK